MMGAVAWIYAALCVVVIGFHLALIAGAPWGHLTQGGRNKGRLPAKARAAAALSALGLVWMALAILSAAGQGVPFPPWAGWVATLMTAVTALGNLTTPSEAERRLWGPVTVVMLVCALPVVLFG